MTPTPFSDALRAAVKADGRSLYAIAKAADVSLQMLTRWLNGERGLRLDSADKLAAALGVTFPQQDESPKPKAGGGKKPKAGR